ncbi:hypothetical protein C6N75_26305 [Streptomyces solincola]|uniref:Uncharacterized protein n=1 Tax=Streptomyces solincola TaxID=2100817 RepID=A0A2S9PPI3_9ACTN|nr:hypothetical protein [Streptomyces solincola]PRH76313.1 hypothetical protein C6N75_26305 [Streptomyces solincola]
MRPDSANGTGGGGLAVPMAWLCAEYTADELLGAGGLAAPGSLEHEAARRVLALTVYLADGAGPGRPEAAGDRVAEWLLRTAHGHPWPHWVRGGLADRGAGHDDAAGAGADGGAALAGAAWRKLETTHLLAADLDGLCGGAQGRPAADGESPLAVDESHRAWLPSWRVALPLAHLTLRLL